MTVTIRSVDKNPYETDVDMDVGSILEIAKDLGLSVSVEFNGDGKITILAESRGDAEGLAEEVFAMLDLINLRL